MGGQLRILSGNLCNGGADPEALAELVRRSGADVAAVQELSRDQAEALAEVLPYGQLEPADDFTGMGIALRRPAKLERVALDYRDARVARLDPADWPELARPVELVNVHIAAPTVPPFWTQLVRRRAQLRGLLAYLEANPREARAVMGDFNATPVWPVYRGVASRLRDLAREHGRASGRRPRRTWPCWPRPLHGLRLLRIDHCFGQGVTAESFEVVDLPGSDHMGLLIELSVR